MQEITRIRQVVRKNWDEIAIATALGHFVTTRDDAISLEHGYVLEALRRSRSDLHHADIEELREYVSSLDGDQLAGLINNIKGIAHEVLYVEAENADGDTVHAYLFQQTNHPDTDVVLYDPSVGERTEIQLKASDSRAYVADAVDGLGADRVAVTSELAERMGLESSGISNERLTADVEDVVDRLHDDESLWDYVPALTTWSVALIVTSLARRYARGEISREQFLRMVALFAGAKAAKIALIVAALSVPGLNIAAGALLFLKLASSVREAYALNRCEAATGNSDIRRPARMKPNLRRTAWDVLVTLPERVEADKR